MRPPLTRTTPHNASALARLATWANRARVLDTLSRVLFDPIYRGPRMLILVTVAGLVVVALLAWGTQGDPGRPVAERPAWDMEP